MPKLLCSKCEVELKPHLNGVDVVEYAEFGPYKLWMADEWECPNCNIKIIAGFSSEWFERYNVRFGE